MPPTGVDRVKTILAEAIEKVGPDRQSFLDQVCGNDASLRGEVESLLAAAEQAGEFLQSPTASRLQHPAMILSAKVPAHPSAPTNCSN